MKVCLRDGIDLDANNLRGWLSPGKAYVVLSVEQYSSDEIGFRVSSEDSEQPVVFRASLFDVLDRKLPNCWVVLEFRPGSIDLGPEAFSQDGFWEKCFDRDPATLDEYRRAKERVIESS